MAYIKPQSKKISTFVCYSRVPVITVHQVCTLLLLLSPQAWWRGHVVRKQQSSRAVEVVRERLRQLDASAQKALSLRHRLPAILLRLKRCKFLYSLASQLQTLGKPLSTLILSSLKICTLYHDVCIAFMETKYIQSITHVVFRPVTMKQCVYPHTTVLGLMNYTYRSIYFK